MILINFLLHGLMAIAPQDSLPERDSIPMKIPVDSGRAIMHPKNESIRSPSGSDWLLTLDLADFGFDGTQTRHFHRWPKQANACCLDVAWYPLEGLHRQLLLGGSTNMGGWRQTIQEDWSHVLVFDASASASALYRFKRAAAGPWLRTDLGMSVLTVRRHTTGVAPGVAAQFRAGWEFLALGRAWQASAGSDGRWWPSLDVSSSPTIVLSMGGWL